MALELPERADAAFSEKWHRKPMQTFEDWGTLGKM